jgi:dephospho-CoA kinase
MLKVGITGGIGSGKSTVCEVFKFLGVPVYHADIEARYIIDSDMEVRNKLIYLFGDNIYNDYKLKRDKFSELIFNDKEALENVNRIVHPKVRSHFLEWAEAHKDKNYTLYEAAILFESGTYKLLDKIITVTAPEKLRIKRILDKKKFNRKIIRNIINIQLPDEEKIKQAHYTIINDDKTLILPQILEIHKKLFNIKRNVTNQCQKYWSRKSEVGSQSSVFGLRTSD